MNRYISEIKINNLFHLKDLNIQIADENAPHLILTGKNGSGKTILLNAVMEFLNKIKDDTNMYFLEYPKWLKDYKEQIDRFPNGSTQYVKAQGQLSNVQKLYDALYEKVDLSFANGYQFINDYQEDNFIIAFYQAARKTDIFEPKNPTKPVLSVKVNEKQNLTSQLLNFLSDLKIQEALARNENLLSDADKIKAWFDNFEVVLGNFFEDSNLKLKFNYKDYSFTINTKGKSFKFTELSDGFIAILDIVADLILRMQAGGSLSTEFIKPGIVLIDEIETHLHLKLQKIILPMLTTLFPNIQFIVTSHSPFVLSSLPNATAYDLEHQEPIVNLTEYSYQALTEGYFGVSTDSDYARLRYEELEKLLKKDNLSDAERLSAKQIIEDYRKIPEATSPELVGAYRQLEISYYNKIENLLKQ
ncbi:MAG: AAA family ATPase [Clostridium sp.]|nr:AAA family ATPase [Clostridium sp.]